MLNRFSIFTAGLVLCAVGAANAADEPTGPFGGNITGSVALTNDYAFRGVSQTQAHPAVQAGLEYAYPIASGIDVYAGVWGSNIDLFDANLEFDTTFGLRGTADKLSYSVNAIYYAYPGAADSLEYNFWEAGFSLAYELPYFTPTVGFRWSPDFFAGSGDAFYPYLDVAVPVPVAAVEPYNLKLLGHVGYTMVDDNARFGMPDYVDWSIGVGFSAFTLDFLLQYVDTDVSSAQCGATDNCDARAVFSVSKAF